MSSHSRSSSDSSFEFVKEDGESQVAKMALKMEQRSKEVQDALDILSINGDVSSDEEAVSVKEESSDEAGVNTSQEVIQNDDTEESEKSETISREVSNTDEFGIGNNVGFTAKVDDLIEKIAEAVKDQQISETTEIRYSDPLGALEPLVGEPNEIEKSELLSEIRQLRSEIEEMKETEVKQNSTV